MMYALKQVGAVKDVVKAAPTPQQIAGVLISRVRTAYTGDRRTAVQELQEMNKRDLREMGAANFIDLMHALRSNRTDEQICDGIMNLVSDLIDTTPPQKPPPSAEDGAAARSASIRSAASGASLSPEQQLQEYLGAFAQKEQELRGVDTLLCVMQDHSFHSKLTVLKFLALLVQDYPEVVHCFSSAAGGLHYLVTLLRCSPEDLNGTILRGETLPLMKNLAMSDPEVQKVLVFEGIFESLLAMIDDEGRLEGSLVVDDCLEIMHHLLSTNSHAQKMFRDQTGFQTLIPLLTFTQSQLTESGCGIVLLTITLISYFLKSRSDPIEFSKTINAIAGITVKDGIEMAANPHNLLTALAGVSIHPTSTRVEAHSEALSILGMLAVESDKIKEQLLSLVLEREGGLYKWVNCAAEYIWMDGRGGEADLKAVSKRQHAAAALVEVLLGSELILPQIAAGVVGEACQASQPHPAASLMRGLVSPDARGCAYCCHLVSLLLQAEPAARQKLVGATFNKAPLMGQALTKLKGLIRDGSRELLHVHSYFKLFLACLPGNSELVLVLTAEPSDISFFVETANADGIEPVSVQVLSAMLLGLAKLVMSESLAHIATNRETIAEEWRQREPRFMALERSLRDALVRRIGVDRLSQRLGALRQDAAFAGATGMTQKASPPVWDTLLVSIAEGAYEAIQQSVLTEALEPQRASPDANDFAQDAAPADTGALRQIMAQQQGDLESLRQELKRVREESAQRSTAPQSALSEEAVAQVRREHLEREEEWQDKLQQADSRIKLLEAELEEERAKRAEDTKMVDIQKRLAEDSAESLAMEKRAMEDENQALLRNFTVLEERLDAYESRLALINMMAMGDTALHAELERTGALRHLEGTYLPAVPAQVQGAGSGITREEFDVVQRREHDLRTELDQLKEDQCDLYVLLGEYHERLTQGKGSLKQPVAQFQ